MDYSNGKIYIIQSKELKENGDRYIGSTKMSLCNRFYQHKRHYIDKSIYVSSHKIFDKYGPDKCEIILIEKFPCNTRRELEKREEELRSLGKYVNEQRAFVTKEIKLLEKKENACIYRENNRQLLRDKAKVKTICECGKTITKNHLLRHKNTKIHLDKMLCLNKE